MKKELYLYSGIYSFTAEDFIRQFEENKNSDIVIRMNTNGGDPQAAFGMIAKMKEHQKDVHIKVDGKAISSGFFMLPYADKVSALNVSSFLVHRAAYPASYEANGMTAQEKDELGRINKDLRAALEKKIDPIKFSLITGVTFDEIFDDTQRIDVRLDAKTAQQIGLVDEVTDINSEDIAAMNKMLFIEDEVTPPTAEQPKKEVVKIENKIMNLQEIKAKHPEVFNEILALGVEKEKERIGAWLTFADVDLEAVSKGIEGGKDISPKSMAELSRKSFSKEALKDVSADSAASVKTEEQPLTASEKDKAEITAEKKVADFLADVKADLKK